MRKNEKERGKNERENQNEKKSEKEKLEKGNERNAISEKGETKPKKILTQETPLVKQVSSKAFRLFRFRTSYF